ncbi:hypothetical protein FB567DRAFT_181136 [Paraphoma chrysanthemicola]|uniref:Uncharacterized protein n=1 Tax=Paraphoma chrysanthemicola TaxID=798071 RepID=A0A8K0RFY6_9PLEO|nr:hypothetical protein FB567DRAFT_181136 [Paraphoma chrysanthemicola]
MATNRVPTPSTSAASRASTFVRDGSERATPTGTPVPVPRQVVATPPASQASDMDMSLRESSQPISEPSAVNSMQVPGTGNFQPYGLLMKTQITLISGKKLQDIQTIHKEMLCCHSTTVQVTFRQAEALSKAYPLADNLRKKLKQFVYPRFSVQNFEDSHAENHAIPVIVQIYSNYPLPEYRKSIQKTLDEVIIEQVAKHNTVGTGKAAVQKKDLKDMGIQARLTALTSKGVFNIAMHLSIELRGVKQKEVKIAETNTTKAAAQRRIFLPNFESPTVSALTHWVYSRGEILNEKGDLKTAHNAEHLYALQGLAAHLGITVLKEQCLSMLVEKTNTMIDFALREGLKLQHLLGWGERVEPPSGDDHAAVPEDCANVHPQDDTVQVVFQHVLKDKNPPKRLVDLVVQTLADHLDLELWAQLEHMINHQMSKNLNKAMVLRRQIKMEEEDCFSVKSEVMSAPNGKF